MTNFTPNLQLPRMDADNQFRANVLEPRDWDDMVDKFDAAVSFRRGRRWYVDEANGADTNDGLSWAFPFATMAAAFAVVQSGDTITFAGNVRAQLSQPVGVFDVTVRGAGNRPRHADAHTGNGGYSAATWRAPGTPAAATPLLRLLQQGWAVENILFAPPSDAYGIEIVRNAGAGDAERDASHATVRGNRFAGGLGGIAIGRAGLFTENVFNPLIVGNIFNDHTERAISAVFSHRAKIIGNEFGDNENHIIGPFNKAVIAGNVFGAFTTESINLATGAANVVGPHNVLSGVYTNEGGYTESGTDTWAGNYTTAGVTVANPAPA